VPDPPTPEDAKAEALRRLMELDRERRRMRQWMDNTEDALGWPSDEELDRFASRRETTED